MSPSLPTPALGHQAHLPLRTPMFDGAGDPDGPALVAKLGNLTRPWSTYLKRVPYSVILRQPLASGLTTTVASPPATVNGQKLTASPTGIVDGQILTVLLQQDETGGGAVAWDSGFSSDAPTTIHTTANAITAFVFAWDAAVSLWRSLSSAGSGSGGAAQLLRVTLVTTVVTTVASPIASGDGQILIVLLTQPTLALGQVAWDTGFSADTPTSIDTATVGSIARVQFFWSAADSKWIFQSMNAGGLI